MGNGYFKVHRSIFDNPLWQSEPFTKSQAWIDLFGRANHADGYFFLRGVRIDVERGQSGRSELTLSKDWKWSRGKVRRFLKWLEKQGMIELKQDNKTTIISICNYDRFQPKDKQDGTPSSTPSSTANGQQTDINNKNKNNKNNKEYSEDSKEFRLSLFLLNTIRKRKPDLKMPNLQKWSEQSDYILRIDKRDPHEVKKVVEWCQLDEFWQDNILSTAKLRKQYDKLVLKMNKDGNSKPDGKLSSNFVNEMKDKYYA